MKEDIFNTFTIDVGPDMKMPAIPTNEPFLVTKLPKVRKGDTTSYEVSYTYDPSLLKD
jgi:hypothetical protein